MAFPITLNQFIFDNNSGKSNDPPAEESYNSNSDQSDRDKDKLLWGVDSASQTDEDLYQCVKSNFGDPEVWGRYLADKEGVSEGLDCDETVYLHDKDVKVPVIYNHFTVATGYDNGAEEAEQAIDYAVELGVPEGVALFRDIEPNSPVNFRVGNMH
ncbi:hypothetical protein [Virgibacillus oceani]|uniref:hypothetical protein n=1 Tax=Virgibacillus oceani TaxID=1479511 RepID=UPI00166D6ADA|nr:hypothetical protein [Virgibacillus oceani]